jgi:hypothetical protein
MVVHSCQVTSGSCRDFPHADSIVAFLGEKGFSLIQEALFGRVVLIILTHDPPFKVCFKRLYQTIV